MKSYPSTCVVSTADYVLHFGGGGAIVPCSSGIAVVGYYGPERRCGAKDRRAVNHDRRWEQSRGRRFRLADRRRPTVA